MNLNRAASAFHIFSKSEALKDQRCLVFIGKSDKFTPNMRSCALLQFLFNAASAPQETAVMFHSGGVACFRAAGGIAPPSAAIKSDRPAAITVVGSADELFSATGSGSVFLLQKENEYLGAGPFVEKVRAAIVSNASSVSDDSKAAANFVTDVVAVKDDDGVTATKKAVALCTAINMRYIFANLALFVAEGKTPSAISNALKEHLDQPNKIEGLEKMQDASSFSSSCIIGSYPLVLSKGCNASLKNNTWQKIATDAVSGAPAAADAVALMYGESYNNHVVGLGRTYFIGGFKPNATTLQAHALLNDIMSAVKDALTVGAKLSGVRESVLQQIRGGGMQKYPAAMLDALPADFGGVVGTHCGDPRLSLSDKAGNSQFVAGMTVVVRVGLTPADVEGLEVPLLLCDTFQLDPASGSSRNLTGKAPSDVEGCTLQPVTLVSADGDKKKKEEEGSDGSSDSDDGSDTSDDDDGDKKTKKKEKTKKKKKGEEVPFVGTITTRVERGLVGESAGAEMRRLDTLKALIKEKHEAWLAAGSPRAGAGASAMEELKVFELGRLGRGDTVAYSERTAVSDKLLSLKNDVHLDEGKYALWLPLNGLGQPLTPIHVAAINKIELKSGGQHEHYFVVTFHSLQESNHAFKANRTKIFVREASFCGPDQGKFYQIQTKVKELQATIKAKDLERKAKQGVIDQKGLKLSARAERLPQVKCRPSPVSVGTGKKANSSAGSGAEGNLEAHENGFRFSYNGGVLDILYSNVKFFIVQPSKNDILVLLHLALHNSILVGGKKTDHVQFVAEVMEGTEAVGGNTRKTHEQELAEEEADAERIRKTNLQFVAYAKKVGEISGLPVQQPFSNINFEGSVARGMVNFRGNDKCLWSVIDAPYWVMDMSVVEIAALERISSGGGNFDMMLVHADGKSTTQISTIPNKSLERVKDWLLHTKTVYFESGINIQWSAMLKMIRDDEDWEPWGPGSGWTTMLDEAVAGSDNGDEDGGDKDDDSDSDYTSVTDSDDSDDSDSDSDSDDFDDSDEPTESDDDDSDDDSDDGKKKKKKPSKPSKKARHESDDDRN